MEIYKINITENRPIINLLGEVCWGFQVENFEKEMGVKKIVAEALLKRLLHEEKSGTLETQISNSELQIIKNVLSKVEKEIEEWEFETRTGVTLEEVKNLSIFKNENL